MMKQKIDTMMAGASCSILFFSVLISLGFVSGCMRPVSQSVRTAADSKSLEMISFLHTNDLHSHLEPTRFDQEPEQGGIARLKTLIDQIKRERGESHVFLFDAGDLFQGTIYFQMFQGSESVMAVNALGYDAITLGNHEFDQGPEALVRALKGLPIQVNGVNFEVEPIFVPIVASNLKIPPTHSLNSLVRSSLILQKGPHRIGVVGVVTETTAHISQPGSEILFLDYVKTVQEKVDILVAQGVNKIILLSHAGYELDVSYAQQLHDVDVIISGHDHVLLADKQKLKQYGLTKQAAQVFNSYPTFVQDRDGVFTVVASAHEWGRRLGDLKIAFDAAGHVLPVASKAQAHWVLGENAALNVDAQRDLEASLLKEDPKVLARLQAYQKPLQHFYQMKIADNPRLIEHGLVNGRSSPLGNLICDVMKQASLADVCLMNSGGIRQSLNQGPVSYAQALSVLPFGNRLVVIELSGQALIDALDNGLSLAHGRSFGAFPQVSGMDIFYWPQQPELSSGSVRQASLKGLSSVVRDLKINGRPVVLSQIYRLATNHFLAQGGDYYESLKNICQKQPKSCVDTQQVILDLMITYLKSQRKALEIDKNRIIPLTF